MRRVPAEFVEARRIAANIAKLPDLLWAALNCGRVHGGFICTQIMRRSGRLGGPAGSGGSI